MVRRTMVCGGVLVFTVGACFRGAPSKELRVDVEKHCTDDASCSALGQRAKALWEANCSGSADHWDCKNIEKLWTQVIQDYGTSYRSIQRERCSHPGSANPRSPQEWDECYKRVAAFERFLQDNEEARGINGGNESLFDSGRKVMVADCINACHSGGQQECCSIEQNAGNLAVQAREAKEAAITGQVVAASCRQDCEQRARECLRNGGNTSREMNKVCDDSYMQCLSVCKSVVRGK
jgi:hypothetical protein